MAVTDKVNTLYVRDEILDWLNEAYDELFDRKDLPSKFVDDMQHKLSLLKQRRVNELRKVVK